MNFLSSGLVSPIRRFLVGAGIDSYVRRIFLGALFGCLFIFTGLWMVGDFFGRLDELLELMEEDPAENTLAVVAGLVAKYFLSNLPFFLHLTAPIVALIAAIYTVNRLLRANELTPMVTAGVSLFRVLRPIFMCTGVFSILVFINQETLLPKLSLDQKHLHSRLKGKSSRELTALPIFTDRLGNRYIIERYDPHPRRRKITRLIMLETAEVDDGVLELKRKLVAPTARWVESGDGHPSGWVLSEGSYEDVRDASGKIERRPIRFLSGAQHSKLKPRLIERANLDKPALNIRELLLKNSRSPDPSLIAEVHRHFTHPLKCLMLLLLALPFLMRAYSRQLTVGPILKCGFTCVVFYLFDLLCMDLGNRGYLGPALSSWLSFAVFGAVFAVLLDKVRT